MNRRHECVIIVLDQMWQLINYLRYILYVFCFRMHVTLAGQNSRAIPNQKASCDRES